MANPKLPYYIIESGRPDYVYLDMSQDPGYKELLTLEKERKLVSPHPTVVPRACLKQTPEMLVEEYVDEETNTVKKRFKEAVVVAEADGRGRIFIEKGKEDLVRRLLKNLRKLDKNVKLDEEGLILPEEMPESERGKVNKGGRPKKNS